jgi:hypothetical protein
MGIAIKIKLQQVGRIIGRLPNAHAPLRMPEPELRKSESADIAVNRPHWIVPTDVVLHPCWQKTRLLPAHAGLK